MREELGIDTGQKELIMALIQKGKVSRRTFRNDPEDFAAVSKWLDKHNVTALHVCIEATGTLWEAIALYLHEAGHPVSVVNPARISAYAKSWLRRNKTDKLDAELIARFCAAQQPELWTPPPASQRSLRDLVRLHDDLQSIKTQQTNRLKSGINAQAVKAHLQAHITYLEGQIAELEAQMKEVIASDEQLSRDFALLISIKGVGFITAALFLAEGIGRYRSARALTAHAGLNPSYHQSGSSVNRPPRLSKIGSARLRKALFFPALSALRWNPCVKALADRLKANNRPKMVIVAAAMRKLLTLAFGVLKSGRPFDPNYAAAQKTPILDTIS
jgi:transposase